MPIEPLLMRLRNEPLFQGITLPLDGTIKLTAYADDVNLYVTQSSNIKDLMQRKKEKKSFSFYIDNILIKTSSI